MDIVLSGVGLVLSTPALAGVAIAIRVKMGRPVIFQQVRPGLHGKPFVMYKFRTMLNLHDKEGNLLSDDERLTPLGRFLRKTSLDELPELWNVLKGDMSLVGPRPLLVEYLPYYTERERKRHSVRPGVTGLAQISGRNLVPWDERLELDVRYVEKQSLGLDLYILAKTIQKVIARHDVLESTAAEGSLNEIRSQSR